MAAIGTESKYTVSHEVITQLEKSGKRIAITEKHYDHCMIEKMEELMMNETGCTVPWVTDKNKICTHLDSSKREFIKSILKIEEIRMMSAQTVATLLMSI